MQKEILFNSTCHVHLKNNIWGHGIMTSINRAQTGPISFYSNSCSLLSCIKINSTAPFIMQHAIEPLFFKWSSISSSATARSYFICNSVQKLAAIQQYVPSLIAVSCETPFLQWIISPILVECACMSLASLFWNINLTHLLRFYIELIKESWY